MQGQEDLTEIGPRLYREVFQEFYDWNDSEMNSIIKSLRRIPPEPSRRLAIEVSDWDDDEYEDEESSSNERVTCSVVTYTGSDTPTERVIPLTVARGGSRKMRAIPRYIQCSPLSRNMDRDMGAGALFVPCADSKQFPITKYLREFPFLEWIKRLNDPDVECLEYEVARRLFALGYTYTEIDDANLFHRGDCTDDCAHDRGDPECNTSPLLLRKGNKSGLVWAFNQRDRPTWSSSLLDINSTESDAVDFPASYTPDRTDILDDVNRGVAQFCPNLSCLYHFCGIHTTSVITAPFKVVRPTLDNSAYTSQHYDCVDRHTDTQEEAENGSDGFCEHDCFRQHVGDRDHWMENLPALCEDDNNTLQGVLKLDPDICPCDLAVICQVSCSQAYAFRLQSFVTLPPPEQSSPDPMPVDYEEEVEEISQPQHQLFRYKQKGFVPYWESGFSSCTCDDAESCATREDCPCNNHEGRLCDRNCRCKLSCTLRFPGCECRDGCAGEKCVCIQNLRECDPERCVKCNARGEKQKRRAGEKRRVSCRNVKITRGDSEPFEVKEAQHGAGAFAGCDMSENTYIGEYVGELRTHNEAFQESFIYKYRKLNYSFDLFENAQKASGFHQKDWASPILDSDYMGNATRSLNHSSDPNCEAMSRFVNGEPRIGIKTSCAIKKGEELFLHYGDEYWKDQDDIDASGEEED